MDISYIYLQFDKFKLIYNSRATAVAATIAVKRVQVFVESTLFYLHLDFCTNKRLERNKRNIKLYFTMLNAWLALGYNYY